MATAAMTTTTTTPECHCQAQAGPFTSTVMALQILSQLKVCLLKPHLGLTGIGDWRKEHGDHGENTEIHRENTKKSLCVSVGDQEVTPLGPLCSFPQIGD